MSRVAGAKAPGKGNRGTAASATQPSSIQAASALAAAATAYANTLPAAVAPAPPMHTSDAIAASPAAARPSRSRSAARSSVRPSSSSSAAAASAPTASFPPSGVTGADDLAPSSSLLSKSAQKSFESRLRAAQRAPHAHVAELQIRALDGLVHSLKRKRARAGTTLRECENEVERIEREEAALRAKLAPLAGRIAANESRRSQLLATKSAADAQMGAIMSQTSAHVNRTQHAIDSFKRRQLKQEMDFQRRMHVRIAPVTDGAASNSAPTGAGADGSSNARKL